MSTAAEQLDTRLEIVTPENIAFEYRLAGPFRRLVAYAIDAGIRVGLIVVLFILTLLVVFVTLRTGLSGLGDLLVGVFLVVLFLSEWLYGALFEIYWNGQTPGKRVAGLRVLTLGGQPIDASQAMLRNVLRYVDSLPVVGAPPLLLPLFQVGFFSALLTGKFQRLGDLAAGTIVVVEERERNYGVLRVNDPAALELAARLPAKLSLPRSTGRALAAYVQRRGIFSPRRLWEMARHLAEPLRVRFGLPRDTSFDLLLCAVYHKAFIADRPGERPDRPAQPFVPSVPPAVESGTPAIRV